MPSSRAARSLAPRGPPWSWPAAPRRPWAARSNRRRTMALRTVLVDCGSRRVPALREAVLEQGADVVTLPLARANAEVEHARPDVLVVSGGPRLFTAEPELLAAFAFLDGFAGPIFGICLGHQALAMRHGARIALGPRRRDFETVTLRGAHPLFAGYGATARFTTSHREG